MQGVENTEDALISIIKSIKKEMKDDIVKVQFEASIASISNETSSSNEEDKDDNNTSITTSYVYKYLGLDKLRDDGTVGNTTGTNEPLGTIDILIKFEKLEFLCNFVIKLADDVIILGKPFLGSTYAQIDRIYMVDIGQEEEIFNPLDIGIGLFSYESTACLEAEQRSRSYGTPNPQDETTKPINFSSDRRGLVKRWHVCKPIHITYDNESSDCGMWPTCDPDSKFCFGYNEVFGVNEQGTLRQWICFHDHERQTMKGSHMGFADFFQVHYGQREIDNTTREQRYYEWGYQEHDDYEPQPIRPRPCNNSFEEWLKIRIRHNNLHEFDREIIFNEWILDSYDVKEEYAKVIGDPYSRSFNEYKRVFNNEIKHLSNEYILRIGKKGYILDDVWEKYQQNYKETNEAWHEKGYEDDELWQSGDEKSNYDPPYVNVKSFKVKIYSFNEGCSFICITDCEDEALPLGHVNGARFKAMIRNELEGNKYVHEET
ncbi:hypothetical protein Tco_1305823 [Tanacetum coccineum]